VRLYRYAFRKTRTSSSRSRPGRYLWRDSSSLSNRPRQHQALPSGRSLTAIDRDTSSNDLRGNSSRLQRPGAPRLCQGPNHLVATSPPKRRPSVDRRIRRACLKVGSQNGISFEYTSSPPRDSLGPDMAEDSCQAQGSPSRHQYESIKASDSTVVSPCLPFGRRAF